MRRVITAFGLALGGLVMPALAQGSSSDPELTPYLKPTHFADIGGGRRVAFNCMGAGSPTVLLLAGSGNWGETWRKVQPAVAAKARVCTWDRAGFGFSSPSPDRQDVAHTTSDLERGLRAARIPGPYVVVGHSLGGLEALVFTDRNRRQVAGLVFEDPSLPGQEDARGPAFRAWFAQYNRQRSALMESCAADARAGKPDPETYGAGACLTFPASYPAALKVALRPGFADPQKWLTRQSLTDQFATDTRITIDPRRNYGDLPLIVLTATVQQPPPPGAAPPPAAAADNETFFRETWPKAHAQLAGLSTRGQHRKIVGASHYIHLLIPEAVIAAINEVVDRARERTPKR